MPSDANVRQTDENPVKVEQRYHGYVGNRIPWYVRGIWLLFWIFAVYYVVTYLFPAIQVELLAPP